MKDYPARPSVLNNQIIAGISDLVEPAVPQDDAAGRRSGRARLARAFSRLGALLAAFRPGGLPGPRRPNGPSGILVPVRVRVAPRSR